MIKIIVRAILLSIVVDMLKTADLMKHEVEVKGEGYNGLRRRLLEEYPDNPVRISGRRAEGARMGYEGLRNIENMKEEEREPVGRRERGRRLGYEGLRNIEIERQKYIADCDKPSETSHKKNS